MDARVTEPEEQLDVELAAEIERKALHLLQEIKQFTPRTGGEADPAAGVAADESDLAREIRYQLEACLQLPVLADRYPKPRSRNYKAAVELIQAHLDDDQAAWDTLFAWLFTHSLAKVVDEVDFASQSRSWMDEWLLGKLVAGALRDLGLDEGAVAWSVGTVKILISHQRWFESDAPRRARAYQTLMSWLRDSEVQQYLQVNRYRDVLWFNQESFDQLLGWMLTLAALEISADPSQTGDRVADEIVASYDLIKKLRRAAEASEYQVVKLMDAAQA